MERKKYILGDFVHASVWPAQRTWVVSHAVGAGMGRHGVNTEDRGGVDQGGQLEGEEGRRRGRGGTGHVAGDLQLHAGRQPRQPEPAPEPPSGKGQGGHWPPASAASLPEHFSVKLRCCSRRPGLGGRWLAGRSLAAQGEPGGRDGWMDGLSSRRRQGSGTLALIDGRQGRHRPCAPLSMSNNPRPWAPGALPSKHAGSRPASQWLAAPTVLRALGWRAGSGPPPRRA